MGTEPLIVTDADHTVEMDMRQLPFVYKVGDFRWGYFDYKGTRYCVREGEGALWAATDPEVIAYGKTLWELSR